MHKKIGKWIQKPLKLIIGGHWNILYIITTNFLANIEDALDKWLHNFVPII